MKDHPLFCDDDSENAGKDIRFINAVKFIGNKRMSLSDQWEPQDLMTIQQVYDAIGPGDFELVGRDATGKAVARARIAMEPKKGEPPQMPKEPTPAAPVAPSPAPANVMQFGATSIPVGSDPTTAFQNNAQNAAAQREDSRHQLAMTVQMFGEFSKAQVNLVNGMFAALAGSQRGTGDVGERAVDLVLKGVELATGLREGAEDAKVKPPEEPQEKPMDWTATTQNVVESLKVVRDIASLGGIGSGSSPVIPPEQT
jgi:hypothetical protein